MLACFYYNDSVTLAKTICDSCNISAIIFPHDTKLGCLFTGKAAKTGLWYFLKRSHTALFINYVGKMSEQMYGQWCILLGLLLLMFRCPLIGTLPGLHNMKHGHLYIITYINLEVKFGGDTLTSMDFRRGCQNSHVLVCMIMM